MSDIGSLFGDFPGRPEHPDFWRLSEIILQLDGKFNEDDAAVEDEVGMECDVATAFYMARQHAERMVENLERIFGGPMHLEVESAIGGSLMAIWFQAFIMGSRFQKRGGHQEQ